MSTHFLFLLAFTDNEAQYHLKQINCDFFNSSNCCMLYYQLKMNVHKNKHLGIIIDIIFVLSEGQSIKSFVIAFLLSVISLLNLVNII